MVFHEKLRRKSGIQQFVVFADKSHFDRLLGRFVFHYGCMHILFVADTVI